MLNFDKGVFLLIALVLLTLPLNWFIGWTVAVLIHEACHIWMIIMLKGKILGIHIGGWGMKIEIAPMSPGKEILCALAGPAGSFLLLGFLRIFPRMAICAAVQAAFNLLPIYPLDGGRALRCGLTGLSPNGEKLAVFIENSAICFVVIAAMMLRMGFYSVILGGIFIIKKISLQSVPTRGTIVLHQEIAKKK